MYSDQKANSVAGYAVSNDAERPESAFTSRIRSICDRTDTFARRLDRVLQNLRGVPPPSPVAGGQPAGLGFVRMQPTRWNRDSSASVGCFVFAHPPNFPSVTRAHSRSRFSCCE